MRASFPKYVHIHLKLVTFNWSADQFQKIVFILTSLIYISRSSENSY